MSKRMRSRCPDSCEADVMIIEADVKANPKPMSRRMRSRCQGDREADVEKMLGEFAPCLNDSPHLSAEEHAEG